MIQEKGVLAYIDTFLNFIFPRNIYCIVCGDGIQNTEKYSMCQPCRDKAPFISSRECEKCGKPLETLYLPSKCPDCVSSTHYFTKGYSCVEYDDHMKQLVYKLKYGKQRYLAYHMAEMMCEKLQKQGLVDLDIIVPVPLYKTKLRQREFNQAQLLAKYIGKAMGRPVDDKHLIRMKETRSQNELSRDERKENMKNAFEIVSEDVFGGKKILLVDDIYTTGSTIDACCKELMKSKPKELYVITFATGRNI